jgi:WD40 repeat protein
VAKVFISHANVDGAVSERVRRWLEHAGHQVFLDQHPQDGITPGEGWENRLYASLRWADAVVCLVTRAYCRSAWCTAEVVIARSQGARLFPLIAEPFTKHELLQSVQSLDLTNDATSARDRLDEALKEIDVVGGLGWPDDLSPYPGLDPFDAERHRAYFGREEDVRRLTAVLRTPIARSDPGVVVVVGPSGSGKSSLVRAGLVPAVASEPDAWAVAPCRLGRDPVGAIVGELAASARALGLERPVLELRKLVREGGLSDVVNDLLLAVPGGRRTRLLLVVDQFEELLTQADATARTEFARVVSPALGRPLQVVATLRPEFLNRLLSSVELAELRAVVHPIVPLRRDELARVIEKPAGIAGLELEKGLVERLVADTDDGDALPLLAYTLQRLAEGAARNGVYRHALLTHAQYDELGGVHGAVRRQADAALGAAKKASGRDRDAVIRELLRLVVVDEQGHPVRWRVAWAELSSLAAEELEAFVKKRLLTTDTDAGTDRAVVEVAHEAFLTAWPPLAQAIERESTALRARRLVEQAASEWAAAGRGTGGLWEGAQLAGVVGVLGARTRRVGPGWHAGLATERVDLSADARDFLLTSVMRDRRRRRRGVAVLSILLIVAVLAGAVALIQARAATVAQRDAIARQLLAQADAARSTDTRTALRLGLAATRIAPDPTATANLVDTLSHTRYARTLAHRTGVVTAAYAPDGSMLVTGEMDGGATVWDLTDPSRPGRTGRAPAHNGYVYDVAFSRDSRTVATAGVDGTAGLWDVTNRMMPRRLGTPLSGHSAAVHAVAFSPMGQTLATVGFDGRLILHDLTDSTRPTITADVDTGHGAQVFDVAFSPDGRSIATAGADRKVRLWNVVDPRRPIPLGTPLAGANSAVWSAKFAPSGGTVSAVDQSGELVTWSADGSSRMIGGPLQVHAGPAYDLAFSPDGSMLATAGADREVGLFSTGDLSRPTRMIGEPLRAHADQVYSVAFAPDGRWLASSGADRTEVLWDLGGPPRAALVGSVSVGGPGGSRAVAVAPSGWLLATGGRDALVQFWDVADPAHPRPFASPVPMPADVRSLAFSADGRLLAAGSGNGAVTLVAFDGPGPPRPVGEVSASGGAASSVAFDPGGERLAVAHEDHSVSMWDVRQPVRPAPVGGPVVVHTGPVHGIAFSADGRTLASAGAEGAILLWDVSGTHGPQAVPPELSAGGAPVFAVAFAPSGTLASGGWDGSVLVWDRSTSGVPRRTPAPSSDGGSVYALGFVGDGGTLAAAGSSGAVTLWDASVPETPRVLGTAVPSAGSPITALSSPLDQTWLAAADAEGVIRMWDISALEDLRAHAPSRACAVAGRGLDVSEWATMVPGLDFEESCPSGA